MAAYTSTQDGPWSLAATWGGGGVPGDGDTASVGHDVEIDGSKTIGTDGGAAVKAIAITSGGLLYVDDSVAGDYALTMKGGFDVQSGGELRLFTGSNPCPSARTFNVQFTGSTGFENKIKGTFRCHGWPSYHMAAASMQRSRLSADAAAGAGVTITLSKAVDWQVGDRIFVGTGGDPDHTPTGCEITTIASKISSTQYTANLSNNHFGSAHHGDVVIHATRNVNIIGESAKGFHFTTDTSNSTIDVGWTRFRYGAGSGTLWQLRGVSGTQWPADDLKINNCSFDEPAAAGAVCMYTNNVWADADPTRENIGELHAFGYGYLWFFGATQGRLKTGMISILDASNNGINNNSGFDCIPDLGGYIYICDASDTNSARVAWTTRYGSIENELKIHRAYSGLIWTSTLAVKLSAHEFKVGSDGFESQVFNVKNSYGMSLEGTSDVAPIKMEEVEFRNCNITAVRISNRPALVEMKDCKFDNCNSAGSSGHGAILCDGSNSIEMKLDGCEFGTDVVNKEANVYASFGNYGMHSRFLARDCTFKEPNGYNTPSDAFYAPELGWCFTNNVVHGEDNRLKFLSLTSWEWVDCSILDSSDAEQWDTLFPDTTKVGIVHAGAEIHKVSSGEADGYIDGTFARKILPYTGLVRSHATRKIPIKIPVTSGETVSVSLQFKKNKSMDSGKRPMLHLEGAGDEDSSEMSDANDSWETLTVTGTAEYDDVLRVWVSAFGIDDPSGWDQHYPAGNASNVTIYCDGLTVTRS